MAFFKRQSIGRIYVIRLNLPDGTTVHKIGMCYSPRSTDRMMEVLRSWFIKYRFVPYAELKLDMACQQASSLESYIHKILEPNAFIPNEKVDGGTEMFIDVNEERLLWFLRCYENSKYSVPPKVPSSLISPLCNWLTSP